ncbi:hypothetical protein PISMIDRAFT_677961, partial [Pisolithus microcarpus 441]
MVEYHGRESSRGQCHDCQCYVHVGQSDERYITSECALLPFLSPRLDLRLLETTRLCIGRIEYSQSRPLISSSASSDESLSIISISSVKSSLSFDAPGSSNSRCDRLFFVRRLYFGKRRLEGPATVSSSESLPSTI